ncbi:MAG: T9SS type A sorting domain-containing protein [Ignavibacteriota bacterium]
MKYTIHLSLLFSLILVASSAKSQPSIQWQKCLGGTKHDQPGGMLPTRDGGYIMAGSSVSSDGDLTTNHGNYDLWIVKINSLGAVQWQRSYGGSGEESGGAIIESVDGGYIIASNTNSDDGDLKGIFTGSTNQSDLWVLKIDSIGNIVWQKIFGGSKNDFPTSIVRGGEGQYLISAYTTSSDGDVENFHGGTGGDIWVLDVSESGSLGWQKTFGGSNDDFGAIYETAGGYAIAGYTNSTDGDVKGRARDTTVEAWLVQLDRNANIIWQKTYGGSGYDGAYSMSPTFDKGCILAGFTGSDDGDVSGIHQPKYFFDSWIIKVDSLGTIEWQKCLGGSNGDEAYSVFQNSDGDYVVSANVASENGDVTGFQGGSDCWIFKLSKTGNLLWQRTLGGTGPDASSGCAIMPANDSGYLVLTMTWSDDGDVHGRHGDSNDVDVWLVKLAPELRDVRTSKNSADQLQAVYPNPTSGRMVISYQLSTTSELKIELFNILGVKIRSIVISKEAPGSYEQQFDISDLQPGSYFFRIEKEGKSVLQRIELIK